MLQQTQVARVEKYWQRFMALFPTLDALASAETSLVLEMWQGLGYNRRALALKRTAEICSREFNGLLPESSEELLALPGIGKATAGGIMAFAYQKPLYVLWRQTYARCSSMSCFRARKGFRQRTRAFGMAYVFCGRPSRLVLRPARLWQLSEINDAQPSRRSKHHTKQSKFEGSRRQKRAELVRFVLARREASFCELVAALPTSKRSRAGRRLKKI